MTYCVGLCVNEGLVMLADSRTNAGVDNISVYSKLFTWIGAPGVQPPRALAVMVAGNLSVTQEMMSLIEEENAANGPMQDQGLETILSAPSLFRVADRLGRLMADVQNRRGPGLAAAGVSSGASLILGGQIGTDRPRLFLVYQAGNSIETTADTPFMQIGEFKYGKPILDRVVRPETSLSDGVKAALLSMDATIRSNLTVGLPLDVALLPVDSFAFTRRRIEADDPVYREISKGWGDHLRSGFQGIPDLPF